MRRLATACLRLAARPAGALALLVLACVPLGVVHAAPAVAPTAAPTSRPPIPVESLFRRGVLADAALSPSGNYLATVASNGAGLDVLTVTDLATRASRVVSEPDLAVLQMAWVSDTRLAYAVRGPGPGTIVHAVDRDGGGHIVLSNSHSAFAGPHSHPLRDWRTFLADPCNAANAGVLYVTNRDAADDDASAVNLVRIDTRTLRGGTVARPGHVATWMLDQDGAPGLVTVAAAGRTQLLYRAGSAGPWRVLDERAEADDANTIVPLQFGPDGTLYVGARAGRDTRALYAFDVATARLADTPLFATPGYDFAGRLVATCASVLGVHVVTDVESIEWFDPAMRQVQARVDRLLPHTTNLVSVPARAQTPWMLVRARSDVEPGAWWLFNASSGTIAPLASSHLPLDASRLGRQHMVRYPTRDGLVMSARLTLPPGDRKTNLPLVVLVHGGPWMHGPICGFEPESQFLASRGYAVLEPTFRGSLGYGDAHFRAGWKQWGRAMQDDVADATRWAIAQHHADPRRICIAGDSYGGYATLMGLVNDPDLYRCGVDWIGITDLELVYDGSWNFPSDLPERFKDHGFKDMIGDPEQDAAQLAATSPLRQAARIGQPLLLAYGGLDRRVPLPQGTRFRDAVRRTNHDVEWIEYPDEGHGWAKVGTNADFWIRVERFLARTIGDADQRAAAALDRPAH